jgi:hypothetical protein
LDFANSEIERLRSKFVGGGANEEIFSLKNIDSLDSQHNPGSNNAGGANNSSEDLMTLKAAIN